MTHSYSLATAYITRFISSWRSPVSHKTCAGASPSCEILRFNLHNQAFHTCPRVLIHKCSSHCVQSRDKTKGHTCCVVNLKRGVVQMSRHGKGNTNCVRLWKKYQQKNSSWRELLLLQASAPALRPRKVWKLIRYYLHLLEESKIYHLERGKICKWPWISHYNHAAERNSQKFSTSSEKMSLEGVTDAA